MMWPTNYGLHEGHFGNDNSSECRRSGGCKDCKIDLLRFWGINGLVVLLIGALLCFGMLREPLPMDKAQDLLIQKDVAGIRCIRVSESFRNGPVWAVKPIGR